MLPRKITYNVYNTLLKLYRNVKDLSIFFYIFIAKAKKYFASFTVLRASKARKTEIFLFKVLLRTFLSRKVRYLAIML